MSPGDGGARGPSRGDAGRPPARDRRRAGPRSGRAQTTIDYAIGISVFLVALVFVFGFAPSIFAPFSIDADSTTVLADRSADRLSGDLLAEAPARPAVLNRTCTVEFFDADGAAPADCRYADDGADLPAALGLSAGADVNATVRSGASVATVDGTRLAAGDSPDGNAEVVVARRSVSVGDEQFRLLVRLW